MKKKVLDSWKRPVEVEIPELSERYPQQLEFQLNTVRDATPEEFDDWWENELKPKGDVQLKFVAMMSVVQILTLVFMMTAFFIIGLGLEK
tara:strand:+ start:209 stop:478 length:270 start_codon:yes stop_codon:yes gene_type:complete